MADNNNNNNDHNRRKKHLACDIMIAYTKIT